MFEPLPSFIRLRRVQRNLTQDRLAKMAGVSRQQLALLEDGENVSLAFLLKVANALELTELPIGGLLLRSAPPDLARTVRAADVLEQLQQTAHQWAAAASEIDEARASLDDLISDAMVPVSPSDVVAAADRLENLSPAERQAAKETLRTLAHSEPAARDTAAKPAARRNRR